MNLNATVGLFPGSVQTVDGFIAIGSAKRLDLGKPLLESNEMSTQRSLDNRPSTSFQRTQVRALRGLGPLNSNR